jgi:hypothetical protein
MSRPDDTRFDSWKEIATYLRHDLRTVRRWEKERSLPVHRVPGGGRTAVYAFRAEIDAWLRNSPDGPRSNGGSPSDNSDGEAVAAATKGHNTSLQSLPAAEAPASRKSGTVVLLGLSASIFAAILFLIFFEFRSHGLVAPSQASFSGRQLLAWNDGKVIWSYDFGQPLRHVAEGEGGGNIQIERLLDGNQEQVLAQVPLLRFDQGNFSTDALYCFTGGGKLLWQRSFDDRVQFAGEDCGPRWDTSALLVTGAGPDRSIWCSTRSFPTSGSILFHFDAKGHSSRHFVNYGHIYSLTEFRTSKGSFLLVGGINNEYSSAVLAVLKETELSGHSPQTGSLSTCSGCPSGKPYRYFVFPRSEVTRVSGVPYNEVHNAMVTGTRVQVQVRESNAAGPTVADWSMYELDHDFIPQSVQFSDHYQETHRRLSAEGKIKHSFEACPERLKPITVRMWSPDQGWKDFPLPAIAQKTRQGLGPTAEKANE